MSSLLKQIDDYLAKGEKGVMLRKKILHFLNNWSIFS
jgi:hypothetical protein